MMASKRTRKIIRTAKRWFRNRNFVLLLTILTFCGSVLIYTHYMKDGKLTGDPQTYTPLLGTIAKAESKGNYNAHFGNASNSSVDFTQMTIAEVLKWQDAFVQQGNASSAVGRYQIINTTLSGLVRQLGINTNQKFDQTMQDTLAIALLERRGLESYVNKEMTTNEFAANLAKEWAGLPKVIGENPEDSYYASDGLNKSQVHSSEVIEAIETIKAKP